VLGATRPTAVNLHWALARMENPPPARPGSPLRRRLAEAAAIAEEDVAQNAAIGQHGLAWKDLIVADGQTLNIMTHCNAGWLATVDWGTALSPVYAATMPACRCMSGYRNPAAQPGPAHRLGTGPARRAAHPDRRQRRRPADAPGQGRRGDRRRRPHRRQRRRRQQGRHLSQGAGLRRQRHSLLRRRAALDLDFACPEGADIPSRSATATNSAWCMASTSTPNPALRQLPAGEDVANPAFDVTPNWLVKAIITERGTCAASREGLLALYPEEAVADLRDELIATARAMQPAGLNKGTGNVSVRQGDGFYITPTGMPYDRLVADDIPLMALDGSHVGARKPSSEWRFHRDLYATRPESAPCCTPIHPSPSAWPACAAIFRLSTT
jgi:methylthioribose-1-phosphate isomerase